ncbi:MAG: metal-dependent hydrolase [Bacteroidetes bacterium]|nr:metal-dependent hydrolase [Bacteroidota bacterium]MBL0139726.1 metal-dependent hydrolase [Bacteroidota bacterium]
MDSLTHTVLGACAGEALAGRKLGKKAMLWGALANNLPDIDVITSGWMNQADSLLAHRGFTHSILFALLMTPILAWWFKRTVKNEQMSFQNWLILWGSGLFFHIGIDALTAYGTGWFEPFNHHRVSFNILFVADPFYTISLLIASIALLVLKSSSNYRKFWMRFGLLISSVYILYAFSNKYSIDKTSRQNFSEQNINEVNYFTTPTPLNNWLWFIVAKTDSGYYTGYRSLFDKTEHIDFTYIARQDSLLQQYKSNDEVQKLIRFSKGYYCVEAMGDTVLLSDLRFGQITDWKNGKSHFVFRYALNNNVNNDLIIQKGRMEGSGKEALEALIERVKGY